MKIKYNNHIIELDPYEIAEKCYDAMVPGSANGICHIYNDGTISFDTMTGGTYIREYELYRISQNAISDAVMEPEELLSEDEYKRLVQKYGEDFDYRNENQVNSIELEDGETFQDRMKECILGDSAEVSEYIEDEIRETIFQTADDEIEIIND